MSFGGRDVLGEVDPPTFIIELVLVDQVVHQAQLLLQVVPVGLLQHAAIIQP